MRSTKALPFMKLTRSRKKLKSLKSKHFQEKMYLYALDGFMMVSTELSSTIHIKER